MQIHFVNVLWVVYLQIIAGSGAAAEPPNARINPPPDDSDNMN
jgi:hypothetical protein